MVCCRKIFNKLKLESVRQQGGNRAAGHAEVISTIHKIPNRDEVFGILTRSNKLFNRQNVRFAASDGKITLNGVPVDILEFGNMRQTEMSNYLLSLPKIPASTTETVSVNSLSMSTLIENIFSGSNVSAVQNLTETKISLSSILNVFQAPIQEKIVIVVQELVKYLRNRDFDVFGILQKILPNVNSWTAILRFVVNYFQEMGSQIKQACLDGATDFVVRAVNEAFSEGSLSKFVLETLAKAFMTTLTELIINYERDTENSETVQNRGVYVTCQICGGMYFKPQ